MLSREVNCFFCFIFLSEGKQMPTVATFTAGIVYSSILLKELPFHSHDQNIDSLHCNP